MDFLIKIFKALANEHRVKLLHALMKKREKEISELAHEQNGDGLKSKLKEIVPEYQPFDMNNHTPPNPQ